MKASIPVRIRAIFNFLYFGLMPSWVYERTCHYRCTYWQHLKMNLCGARDWILGYENEDDVAFVLQPCKYFRWQ